MQILGAIACEVDGLPDFPDACEAWPKNLDLHDSEQSSDGRAKHCVRRLLAVPSAVGAMWSVYEPRPSRHLHALPFANCGESSKEHHPSNFLMAGLEGPKGHQGRADASARRRRAVFKLLTGRIIITES